MLERLDWRAAAMPLLAACLIIVGFLPNRSSAQDAKGKTIIIGTLGTGTINYAGAVALADLLNKEAGVRASVLPQTGVPGLLALLDDGSIQVATISAPDAQMSNTGTRVFDKRRQALRLLHPFYSVEQGLLAAADAGITNAKEIARKRVVGRYSGDPGLEIGILAQLANRGMSYSDIVLVPVTSYPESMRSVIERRADVVASGLTSPLVQQLRAARGFRIIPADDSAEAVARTKKVAPGFNVVSMPRTDASLAWMKDDPNLKDSVTLLQYWFCLVASPKLDPEIAYAVNKTVWNHYAKLGPAQIKFARDWKPENMATTDIVIPYHPGAVRWFTEAKSWSGAMEKAQQELLAAEPK
jgi:TRAP transporter TAXI family solute receptor